MFDMKMLGANIRKVRKFRGLTQEELARKAKLSTMSIRRYESGERMVTEKVMYQIARALDAEMYEFFPEYEANNIDFPWWPLRPPVVVTQDATFGGEVTISGPSDSLFWGIDSLSGSLPFILLANAYAQLSPKGQDKVSAYAEDLLPKYPRIPAPQSPPVPQEGTDTTPPPEGTEGPQEGGEEGGETRPPTPDTPREETPTESA